MQVMRCAARYLQCRRWKRAQLEPINRNHKGDLQQTAGYPLQQFAFYRRKTYCAQLSAHTSRSWLETKGIARRRHPPHLGLAVGAVAGRKMSLCPLCHSDPIHAPERRGGHHCSVPDLAGCHGPDWRGRWIGDSTQRGSVSLLTDLSNIDGHSLPKRRRTWGCWSRRPGKLVVRGRTPAPYRTAYRGAAAYRRRYPTRDHG